MGTFDLQRHERPGGPRLPFGTVAITRDEPGPVKLIATAIAQDDSASVETIALSLDRQKPRDAYVANVLLLCYKLAMLQCRHEASFDDFFAAGIDVALRLVEKDDFTKLADAKQRIAYAFRSISNEIIDQHRRRAAESRGIERLFHEQRAETKGKRSDIEELEHTEHVLSQIQRVEKCLVGGELQDADREVVEVIRRKGELSSQELADELGTTAVVARQRLHRAKKRLRKALCGDGNDGAFPEKPSGRTTARRKPDVAGATPDSASPFILPAADISMAATYSSQDDEQAPIW
jgi:RNA polymerase sigma factor (sigma-70 family)